jgi:hypothetical protein
MMKRLFLAISIGASLFGLTSTAGAGTVNSWYFKAYGGFAKLHAGDFPSPGYKVLLTPLPPRDHEDMGAFHWGEFAKPSVLGINQKKPLHGKSWKAPGRYYSQINPIKPDITSIHGNPISKIETDDSTGEVGEVIGWVTHYNNLIAEDFEKARVAVNYHLQLFANEEDEEPVWDSEEMFFFMDVFETDNRLECCPDGSSNPPRTIMAVQTASESVF